MLIRPFNGSIVIPEHAAESVTPAFETLDAAERAELVDRRPRSYLHVVAGEVEGTDATRRAAQLERYAAALERLIAEGVFARTERPTAIAYRVDTGSRSHTGLLVEVAVAEHLAGRVRPHEQIRTEKAERFTAHLRAVGASSTPALLIHEPAAEIAAIRGELTAQPPHIDVNAVDGARHRLWIDATPDLVGRLSELLTALDTLYVADGHHRIAAAARLAEDIEGEGTGSGPDGDPHATFLACLMAMDDVELLPYHRLISDLGAPGRDQVLAALDGAVPIEPIEAPAGAAVRPQRRGCVTMRIGEEWFRAELDVEADRGGEDVVFDAELLQDRVLAPVFGIADPTTDRRLSFVSDDRLDELVERCRDGSAIGFVLAPAEVGDVIAVADAGRVVPPKATWFRPKLPSGLVLHHLGPGTTGGAGSTGTDSHGRPGARSRARRGT